METTILILVMILWQHSVLATNESDDPYTKILDDCKERYISSTRDKDNRYLSNSNKTWNVIVSETQCVSMLSIHIIKLSIYTNNDSCTDYLKIEEFNSSRVLFHSCEGKKKNNIETAGHGVKISFISDDVHQKKEFHLSVKKNCSQNRSICISKLSSLTPATFNVRESISTKEFQEHLLAGVLSTQYLTATTIPFKDTTHLTVVILASLLAGVICTSVFVAVVILIRKNRNKKDKTANRSIHMPRTSLYATPENLNERKSSETNYCITNFAETAVIEERCIGAVPGNIIDVTNTGISQISECEAEKIQVSLAMNTKCLDSNHSGSPQQDDNEVNPYCDNPSYDILYRPRPLVYEKQCNIYKTHI